jgi:hypothetical protein
MLSFESERRLLNLFEAVKNGEVGQEIRRQRLCSNHSFSPYSAFMRIDRSANERISSFELLTFLRDNREYTVTEGDCYNLLKYFDVDEDGYLTPGE